MATGFEAFVIFAEMRTGSNHLEAMLDGAPGVVGHGEVYNPSFVGRPNQDSLMGFDLGQRDADPVALFDTIHARTDGLPGFRFFHDHDPRVLDRILPDPRVAKVVLTRNPLDSYISRKIAAETGQWKLTDMRHRRAAQATFDPAEFSEMLAAWSNFQSMVRRRLQETGQTAFHLQYEDINDGAILNGLLRYLGVEGQIDPKASKLKPQNPGTPADKVTNPDVMAAALAELDPMALDRLPWQEPARPPAVPSYLALPDAGLLYLPIPGSLGSEMAEWMAGLSQAALLSGMKQRDLRGWMRQFPGHRKFTVVRHPLARAHHVFCRDILPGGRPAFADARKQLRNRYKVALPRGGPGADYTAKEHRAAFLGWLGFLKGCLAGQTNLAPKPAWIGQLAALQGMAPVAAPDRVFRDDELATGLQDLSGVLGLAPHPAPSAAADQPFLLSAIYDDEIEQACRDIYRRDYIGLGFGAWSDRPAG